LLPNFDETQIDAIFAEIASPNVDMQQNMYGYNIYRRLLRAGYEAKLHKSDGNFSHITIAADDDYFLEITPIIAKGGSPKPLMSHQAFSQFIQGALFSIAKKFDTEVYPQMRSNRRKHF